MKIANKNSGIIMMNLKTCAAGVLAGMIAAGPAAAVEGEWGGLNVSLTNKLSVGAAMRLSDRDPDLVGIANGGNAFTTNGDDGNLAFDQGDWVSGTMKLTSDLSIGFGNFGAFIRGSGIYSPVLDGKDDFFDTGDYGAGREFGLSELERKTDAVHSQVGLHGDLMDAYVFGNLGLGQRSLTFRLGRQALNWGESLLVVNGLNSILAYDVNRLRVPGFEFEELARPAAMAWLSLDPMDNVNLEAFYQFEWRPTIIDASGTLWSTNDFAGIGGTQANLGFGRATENQAASVNANPATWCLPPPSLAPGFGSPCIPFGSTVPRADDVEPSDSGQYGGAIHTLVPFLNDMDLALYGANYHSRLPVLSGTSRSGPITPADDANYFVEYPEDIQMYGLSFNTTLPALDVALQGEYSYKLDQPLQVDDVELLLAGLGAPGQISPLSGGTLGNQYLRGWRRFDVNQTDVSITKIFGPKFGYDQLSFFIEVGAVHVNNLPDPSVLAFDAPATSTLNPGTAALNPSTAFGLPITPYDAYATASSWGYRAAGRFTFNNVFNAFTEEITLVFQHDVNGTTPTPIVNFVEDRKQVTCAVNLDYLSTWSVGLGYTNYFGAAARNLLSDRDFVDFNIKYSF